MKPETIKNHTLLMGVDTLSIASPDDKTFDLAEYPFLYGRVSRRTDGKDGIQYRVNPDKWDTSRTKQELGIYDYAEFAETLKAIVNKMDIQYPEITRLDFRFDNFDKDSYVNMLKLNKFLILLVAESENIQNRYQSYDPKTLVDLTIRVESKYLELENYNKAVQEPQGIVTNRLEIRDKAVTADPYSEWVRLKSILRRAITPAVADELLHEMNDYLLDAFDFYVNDLAKHRKDGTISPKSRGFEHRLNGFFTAYRYSIFTKEQAIDLIARIKGKQILDAHSTDGTTFDFKDVAAECMRYARSKYKTLTDGNHIELFTLQNVKDYYKHLCDSSKMFFGNNIVVDTIPQKSSCDKPRCTRARREIFVSNKIRVEQEQEQPTIQATSSQRKQPYLVFNPYS